jgi:hypothetical protein
MRSRYRVSPWQINTFPWKLLEYNNCFLCDQSQDVITETSLEISQLQLRVVIESAAVENQRVTELVGSESRRVVTESAVREL